jgi:Raf kinase inhibitor-like YbhB/YbcL family protein
LEIQEVPPGAQSLVLIMDDPDVPKCVREDQMWVHWVIYDMPPTTQHLAENALPPGTVGTGTERKGYQGPCPPDREHRYFFKLYALNTQLGLPPGATKEVVEQKMKGHILAEAQLVGRYALCKNCC